MNAPMFPGPAPSVLTIPPLTVNGMLEQSQEDVTGGIEVMVTHLLSLFATSHRRTIVDVVGNTEKQAEVVHISASRSSTSPASTGCLFFDHHAVSSEILCLPLTG